MIRKPRICAVIVDEDLEGIEEVEPFISLYEVRIDLIGESWRRLVSRLKKPWLACNRREDEGGSWKGSEEERKEELLRAVALGAKIVDVELGTEGLDGVVERIKKRAKCLISFHHLRETPPLEKLKEIVREELSSGADICKVVTTAQRLEDNLIPLKLIRELQGVDIVSFAMGPLGFTSRVLSPLVGGKFTYASIRRGKESASGQIAVSELVQIYGMMR